MILPANDADRVRWPGAMAGWDGRRNGLARAPLIGGKLPVEARDVVWSGRHTYTELSGRESCTCRIRNMPQTLEKMVHWLESSRESA